MSLPTADASSGGSAPVDAEPLLPIVYIRGYAAATSGIDTQVDDPFHGFNHGATHVRVGGYGDLGARHDVRVDPRSQIRCYPESRRSLGSAGARGRGLRSAGRVLPDRHRSEGVRLTFLLNDRNRPS
jgi:hypothetical protein